MLKIVQGIDGCSNECLFKSFTKENFGIFYIEGILRYGTLVVFGLNGGKKVSDLRTLLKIDTVSESKFLGDLTHPTY